MMEKAGALNRRARYLFILSAVVFIMALSLYGWGIKGGSKAKIEAERALLELEEEVHAYRQTIEELKKQGDQLDPLAQAAPVPSTPMLGEVVLHLDAWEEESGLSIEEITFALLDGDQENIPASPLGQELVETLLEQGDPLPRSFDLGLSAENLPWSIVEVVTRFKGSWEQLDQFMKAVTASSRIFHLYYLDFTGDGGGDSQLQGTLVLHTYYSEAFNLD